MAAEEVRPTMVPRGRQPKGGDPNLRLTGLAGRFLRPGLLALFGVLLMLPDLLGGRWPWAWEWDWPLDPDAQLTRLGGALLAVGLLWATAVGFALGTLRLVSAATLMVFVVLLTGIGGATQREDDYADYQSLRHELEIEFNLLRGARTSRAEVAEALVAAEASYLEGQRTLAAADLVLFELGCWSETDSVVDPHRERIEQLTEELELQLGPTKQAVDDGWAALGLTRPDALASTGEPGEDPSCTGGEETAQESEVGEGEPGSDEQESDEETGGPGTADELVDRGRESAGAEARHGMGQARQGAEAIEGATNGLWRLFYQLGFTDTAGGLVDRLDWRPPPGLQPPNQSPTDQEAAVCGQATGVPDFARVVAAADVCVSACSVDDAQEKAAERVGENAADVAEEGDVIVAAGEEGGADTVIEGECEPQRAKRLLLLGFQERLAQFTEGEDVGEGQDELLARLDEVERDLQAIREPVAVHQLAMTGADRVLGDFVRAVALDDQRPARLGGWGWLILALTGIIGYRFLEIANGRRSPSPVSVVVGDTNEETKTKSEAAANLVRAHLTAANLREPSPLPGGEAVASIAASTEAARIDNQLIGYVVEVLQHTAFPRRSLDLVITAQPFQDGLSPRPEVDGDRVPPTPPPRRTERTERTDPDHSRLGRDPYRIMVRAASSRLKGPAFSHLFTGKTLADVTEAAAYFAAERLLDAGWTTPPWLVWSSHDGTALRAYQKVMLEKSSPPQLADETDRVMTPGQARDQLNQAVRSSPGTGAALVALSQEEVVLGELAASLHHLLLARIRHERFLTVRYRLGVTLSMVAGNIVEHWKLDRGKPGAWRTEPHVAGAVGALQRLMPGRWPDQLDQADVKVLQTLLLELALEELDFVEEAVKKRCILLRARRQAERQYWLGLLRSARRRRSLKAAAISGRALARRRLINVGGPSDRVADVTPETCTEQIAAALDIIDDDWLVRYNAACYLVAVGQERAVARDRANELAKHQDLPPDERAAALDGAAEHDSAVEDLFERAFEHLLLSRYARNGQQLSPIWADRDPDLQALREHCGDGNWTERLAGVFHLTVGELDKLLERHLDGVEPQLDPTIPGPMAPAATPRGHPSPDPADGSNPRFVAPPIASSGGVESARSLSRIGRRGSTRPGPRVFRSGWSSMMRS